MPIDHLANTNNGNAIKKIATTTTTLSGRTSNLPIYNVNLSALKDVVGGKLLTVIGSIKTDNDKDLQNGYRQPTDHEDRDGNLPAPPGNGVQYREYFVADNNLAKPGYVRLVADLHNKRMYITPTHYDAWVQDRQAAGKLDGGTAVTGATAGAHSPFFLIMTKA
ncbi:MAG TPA: hypothetical protein VHP37_22960 [Burkholderiales bacterium]|nr:hypothetical protein [Burkholderiales bacterium]